MPARAILALIALVTGPNSTRLLLVQFMPVTRAINAKLHSQPCYQLYIAAVVGQSLVCWTSVCTTYIRCVYHIYIYTLCVTCLLQSDSQFCMHNTFCVSFRQPTHSSLLSSAVLDRMYHTVCIMSGAHKVYLSLAQSSCYCMTVHFCMAF